MSQATFQPIYLFPSEYGTYGMAAAAASDPDFANKVAQASSLIDIYCLKPDADGYGSLVYSTFTERVLIKGHNPNVFRVTKRPLFGVDRATITALTASGMASGAVVDGYDNGALASSVIRMNGNGTDLCAIISLSGRYSQARNNSMLDNWMSPLQNATGLSTLFGGSPVWTEIDPAGCDYNPRSGEIWASAGSVFFGQFSEVEITYTSGFDPRSMPRPIKQACANIIKNMRVRPVPGVKQQSFTDAALNMTFTDGGYIDPHTASLLDTYRNTVFG